MSTPAQPLIDIRGLTHTYLSGTPLETKSLRGVDLQVYPGETVGIVGPTGSGKSTLLQHMNGLLRPQQGQVLVNGISLADPGIDIRAIRQCIGLVFQNPEDQLFERYAGDDVAYGPRNLGLPPDQVRERVRQAMEMVGLPFAYKDRLITELSQGERRRLALAGVLALDPQVLVLDEPTAGLDPQGRREILRILAQWRAQPERAVVLASHNMEDIAELANRVYVLVEGRIVLHGSPQEVFAQHELLTQHGLAVPVATEIMLQLHKHGFPVSTSALSIDEAVCEIEGLLYGRTH
ncbi:MAG: energy-coupling factor transporter ATPase [Chloroflexi bacterium]|nr:energy-coupling factor transporter ATPase [Chloroflexota bacterium]